MIIGGVSGTVFLHLLMPMECIGQVEEGKRGPQLQHVLCQVDDELSGGQEAFIIQEVDASK